MPSPPQPEQAMFLRDSHLLPLLKNEQPVTRRVIEAIPIDKSDVRVLSWLALWTAKK